MGWGTGNLGGGSGGLNFKVVGYATEAELLADTPKENTIGIITTNKITGWMFAAADPAEPVEGMVYITTGKESDIAFNALKKNGIMVYPMSAKQYVSGAWVDVTAMSYQGGEWVSWWDGSLYENGELYHVLKNGFEPIRSTSIVIYNTDHFLLYEDSDTQGGGLSSPEKIDVSAFTTLSLEGCVTFSTSAPSNYKVGFATEKDTSAFVSYVLVPIKSTGVVQSFSLPIPEGGGSFYLVIQVGASTSSAKSIKMSKIKLDK